MKGEGHETSCLHDTDLEIQKRRRIRRRKEIQQVQASEGKRVRDRTEKKGENMRYFTDGSSTIGVKSAYCVTDDKGHVLDMQMSIAPEHTNNEEEYRGIIAALEMCVDGDEVFTDSLLAVNQIAGKFKVKKPHLLPLWARVQQILAVKKVKVSWIPRDENLAGKVFEK